MAMTEESQASLQMQHARKPSNMKGKHCEAPTSNGGTPPGEDTSNSTDEDVAEGAAECSYEMHRDEFSEATFQQHGDIEDRSSDNEKHKGGELIERAEGSSDGSVEISDGRLDRTDGIPGMAEDSVERADESLERPEGSSERAEGSLERPTTRSDNKSVPVTCCMKCDTEQSTAWHKTSQGIVLCSSCSQDGSIGSKGYKNKLHCKRLNNMQNKRGAKKNKDGKLRKSSHKLPHKEATYITSHQIYYKGVRYKIGDVFSIRGYSRLYYVCVKSFMEDPLCNYYAVIIWLLPLYPDPQSYSPGDFLLGPAEDVPRPLDCLSFVSHDPPQGNITLNELRCYDNIPDLWEGRDAVTSQGSPDRSGLDLLLEAMEPDIHQIR